SYGGQPFSGPRCKTGSRKSCTSVAAACRWIPWLCGPLNWTSGLNVIAHGWNQPFVNPQRASTCAGPMIPGSLVGGQVGSGDVTSHPLLLSGWESKRDVSLRYGQEGRCRAGRQLVRIRGHDVGRDRLALVNGHQRRVAGEVVHVEVGLRGG